MNKHPKAYKIIEILIAIISFISGAILVYLSIYLIYGYHFTNSFWFMMSPMTTLVSELVLGITLITSSILIFINTGKGALLYRLSGILVVLHIINTGLLDILHIGIFSYRFWNIVVLLPLGLFLFFFFNQKRYTRNSVPHNTRLFMAAISICFMIDIAFYHWTYY